MHARPPPTTSIDAREVDEALQVCRHLLEARERIFAPILRSLAARLRPRLSLLTRNRSGRTAGAVPRVDVDDAIPRIE